MTHPHYSSRATAEITPRDWRWGLASLLVLALMRAASASAAGVVGTGTPQSCTEAALDAALTGGGSITFNCGTSSATLTLTTTKTIGVDTSLDGGGLITLSGGGRVEVFVVNAGATLDLANLTIANGQSNITGGGAIYNEGTLTLTNTTFSRNSASEGDGGAIWNIGTANVTNSSFLYNSAGYGDNGGGAIYNEEGGMLTVTGSIFSGNRAAPEVYGGAIESYGTLTVINSTFSANRSDYSGGAIFNEDSGMATVTNSTFSANSTSEEYGGAIGSGGTLIVTDSTFSGNSASEEVGFGGAIASAGMLTVTNSSFSGNSTGLLGGGAISNLGTLTVAGSSFSGNDGSAIFNEEGTVTMTDSTIADNSAYEGGGIFDDFGSLTVTRCAFLHNVAEGNGGGIAKSGGTLVVTGCSFTGNRADGHGGGMFHGDDSLLLSDSTFTDNTAGGFGGGIGNGGGAAVATVTGCTLTGNGAQNGGGIGIDWGTIQVLNCTIANNSATASGGGFFTGTGSVVASLVASTLTSNLAPFGGGIFAASTLTLTNVLVAHSGGGGDCMGDPAAVTDGGHNLIEDPAHSCGLMNGENGNLVGVDPQLDPAGLTDNGGPTQTIALLPGSPAINAGDLQVCANPPVNGVDQRGYVRPGSGYATCCIGAYEYNSPGTPPPTRTPTITPTRPTSTPTPTPTITPTQPTSTPTPTPTITPTPPPTSTPVHEVVGTGSAASCTEAALDAALLDASVFQNGVVTFNCGPDPVTITLTDEKTVSAVLTVDGGNKITLSGDHAVRIFNVGSGGSVVLQNLTIADGKAVDGAGIYNNGALALRHCAMIGNKAGSGGGIASSGGTVEVTDSTFTGNRADGGNGGGISIGDGGTLTLVDSTFTSNMNLAGNIGGAVAVGGNAVATITGCTFTGNGAVRGGGIAVDWGILHVTNSTVTGNSATDSGGGIFGGAYGEVTAVVVNNTLTDNAAPHGGGVRYISSSGFTVADTLIANSRFGGDCVSDAVPTTDSGHNLIADTANACGLTNGVNGNLIGIDPMLDPAGLKDNGGPTQTIALLPNSPAINAGDAAVCASAPVNRIDQRGYVRPGTGSVTCSIGAFEFDSPGPPVCEVGDCNNDAAVTIDELISLVNIALGTALPSACLNGIPSGAEVNIALMIQAVNNALNGCSGVPPSPTLTATVTPTRPTATRTPTASRTPTATRTPTRTRTFTPTRSFTPTRTPTKTPTPTRTPTATRTTSA